MNIYDRLQRSDVAHPVAMDNGRLEGLIVKIYVDNRLVGGGFLGAVPNLPVLVASKLDVVVEPVVVP